MTIDDFLNLKTVITTIIASAFGGGVAWATQKAAISTNSKDIIKLADLHEKSKIEQEIINKSLNESKVSIAACIPCGKRTEEHIIAAKNFTNDVKNTVNEIKAEIFLMKKDLSKSNIKMAEIKTALDILLERRRENRFKINDYNDDLEINDDQEINGDN